MSIDQPKNQTLDIRDLNSSSTVHVCETALYTTPADDLNTCLLQRHRDQSSPRQKPLPAGDFVMRITAIAFLPSLAILPPHSLPLQISYLYIFWAPAHSFTLSSLRSQRVLLFVPRPLLSLLPRESERIELGTDGNEYETRLADGQLGAKHERQRHAGEMRSNKASLAHNECTFGAVQIG